MASFSGATGAGAGKTGTSAILTADANWETSFRNRHLTDTTSTEFLASYRTVIYARPTKLQENGSVEAINDITSADTAQTFRAVGVVQNYTWQEQRAVNYIWELGSDVPYLIPDRTYGTIQIGRVMIIGNDIVNALYNGDLKGAAVNNKNEFAGVSLLNSIKDATKPLDILFVAFATNGSGDTKYSRVFKNCHIESRTEQIQAGQVTLMEDVSMRYEAIVGISLPNKEYGESSTVDNKAEPTE